MTVLPAALLAEAVNRIDIGVAIQDEQGQYLYINEVLAAMHELSVAEHYGRTVLEVLGDLGGPVMELQRRVFETGEPVVGAVLAGALPGEPERIGHWRAGYQLIEHGGVRAVLTTVTDVTREHTARLDNERRAHRQDTLAGLAAGALEGAAADQLVDQALEALVRDLGTPMTGVMVFEEDGLAVQLRAGRGWPPGLVGSLRLPVTPGKVLERLAASTEPVVSDDLFGDPRFGGTPRARELGIRGGIGQAIRANGAVWGILAAASSEPRTFGPDDLRHVVSVAGLISTVVEREAHEAELERRTSQRRRMVAAALGAADAERRRIAEVLHDDLLQHLLYARQECHASGLAHADPGLDRAAAALEEATRRLRGLIGEVHPVALSFTGIEPALATLAAELADRAGYEVAIEVEPGEDASLDPLVVGLARELLTNAGRHAAAAHVHVRVERDEEQIRLTVLDDGRGLEPGVPERALGEGHIGLASVIERAEAVGGSVAFGPGLGGRGTGVVVTLPC